MMRVLIVSGGEAPSKGLFWGLYRPGDILIGADKGAEFFLQEGVTPDLLLGDFDSISPETLSFFEGKCRILRFAAEKDFTDTEAAYQEALTWHPQEIYLLGCTGTRLDHFLGNLSLLDRAEKAGIRAYLQDDHNKIFILGKSGKICKDFGDYVSFQAYGGPVENFGLRGTQYPLEDYTLRLGDPRTVSNVITGEEMEVSFSAGTLLVLLTRD